MKTIVFCIFCIVMAFFVNAQAENQMRQDLNRIDYYQTDK